MDAPKEGPPGLIVGPSVRNLEAFPEQAFEH
jgi:hypothetical protein